MKNDIDFIRLGDLASEIRMHKSNLFKLIKKEGIETKRVRDPKSNNQAIVVLDAINAEKVRKLRQEYAPVHKRNNESLFYMVLPNPDTSPAVVKFGFTDRLSSRLREYRTICPLAELLKTWPIESESHEPTVIKMAITKDDIRIGGEVYRLKSISHTVSRLDKIFSIFND